jgi:hypothetical protein
MTKETTTTKTVTATIKGHDGRTAEIPVKAGEWGQQRYTRSCVLLDSPSSDRSCVDTNHWVNGAGFLDVFIEGQEKPVWIYVGVKGSHRIYTLVNNLGEIVGLGA